MEDKDKECLDVPLPREIVEKIKGHIPTEVKEKTKGSEKDEKRKQ